MHYHGEKLTAVHCTQQDENSIEICRGCSIDRTNGQNIWILAVRATNWEFLEIETFLHYTNNSDRICARNSKFLFEVTVRTRGLAWRRSPPEMDRYLPYLVSTYRCDLRKIENRVIFALNCCRIMARNSNFEYSCSSSSRSMRRSASWPRRGITIRLVRNVKLIKVL